MARSDRHIDRPGEKRGIALPFEPVAVAVNADGSLVAALVDRPGDNYSMVPIDVATGKVGAPATRRHVRDGDA